MIKKDQQIAKGEKHICKLKEEIDRRKFVESRVQKYVKGLINQNQRYTTFLEKLKTEKLNTA